MDILPIKNNPSVEILVQNQVIVIGCGRDGTQESREANSYLLQDRLWIYTHIQSPCTSRARSSVYSATDQLA